MLSRAFKRKNLPLLSYYVDYTTCGFGIDMQPFLLCYTPNFDLVPHSGIPQGKLIKRQKVPKNDFGDCWHWKDLNIGMDIAMYGKVFHIYDCDRWTEVCKPLKIGFLKQYYSNKFKQYCKQ